MNNTGNGLLVFVVGDSGVGKDSLLKAAQNALEADERFYFPRRLITRQSVAELEDHDCISFDDYTRMVVEGEAALNWQAHGLFYVIPKTIDAELAKGKIVVCNVSRNILAEAAKIYPVHILNITADMDLRAQRLALRGREDAQSIKQRLARSAIELPNHIPTTLIENNEELEDCVERFIDILRNL